MGRGNRKKFEPPAVIDGIVLTDFHAHTVKVAPAAIMERAKDLYAAGEYGTPIFSEDCKTVTSSDFLGSRGESYVVTLRLDAGFGASSCECAFFAGSPGVPCKHLVTLAMWAAGEGRAQVEDSALRQRMVAKTGLRRVKPHRSI